jgi:hypothetical protein
LGEANPISSIHDQGAGGSGNVLKEIVHPAGGRFEVRNILVGDASLSVMKKYGEQNFKKTTPFLFQMMKRCLDDFKTFVNLKERHFQWLVLSQMMVVLYFMMLEMIPHTIQS